MSADDTSPLAIDRPHPNLMAYYFLKSLALGPLFPLLLMPLYFRYHTLRYLFDEQGVTMRWGVLFRREISLTYSRLQDIHLSSNLLERWLGLARIQLQTASGSAKAEMTIEGVLDFERLRDALYLRMRGAEGQTETPASSDRPAAGSDELAAALHAVAHELAEVRRLLEERREAPGGEPVPTTDLGDR